MSPKSNVQSHYKSLQARVTGQWVPHIGPCKLSWQDQMGELLDTYDLAGLPLVNPAAITNWMYNILRAGRNRPKFSGAGLALYQLMEEVLDVYPGSQQGMDQLVKFMAAWLRAHGKTDTKAAGNKKRKKEADDADDPFDSALCRHSHQQHCV